MSINLPKRQTVVEQTAQYIRSQIGAGHWVGKLPSLRALHSQLQVSRNTVQRALALLESEGVVRRMDRSRTLVHQPVSAVRGAEMEKRVGWLDGEPVWNMSGLQIRDILHLQVYLQDRGISFELFANQVAREVFSAGRLRQWVGQKSFTTWILSNVNEEVQRFFSQKPLPAVVLGSVAPDVQLPCIDLNARATCRHAVSRLLTLGHRRIGLMLPKRASFDDTERVAGFDEGLRGTGHGGVVLRHDGSNAGIEACIRRCLSSRNTPLSGLIVSRASEALTVMTYMGCVLGVRVPADVSLISLGGDSSFEHISPFLTHYYFDRNLVVRRCFQTITHLETRSAEHHVKLAPQFAKGETLAPPREDIPS